MSDKEEDYAAIDLTKVPGGICLDLLIENSKKNESIDPNQDFSSNTEQEQILLEFFRDCDCQV